MSGLCRGLINGLTARRAAHAAGFSQLVRRGHHTARGGARAEQHGKREGLQRISRQHRRRVAKHHVTGRFATSHIVNVHAWHVVMNHFHGYSGVVGQLRSRANRRSLQPTMTNGPEGPLVIVESALC